MRCRLLSDNELDFFTFSEEETARIGYVMGLSAYPGLAIMLRGELGAGKTALTKGIGAAMGIKKIKSPTFTIVSEHRGAKELVHADLYRINDFSEADSLALEEYVDEGRILVVEWAERWDAEGLKNVWNVMIRAVTNESERHIKLSLGGEKSVEIARNILEELTPECEKI